MGLIVAAKAGAGHHGVWFMGVLCHGCVSAGCSVVGVVCDIRECCSVVCDAAGVAGDIRGGAWPSAKYGTRPRAAVLGVCTHTRSVCQSSVDSAGRGRGDMGCDRHLDQTTKGQAAGTPVAADTVGSSTPAGEALRTFAAWVRGRGAMEMGVETDTARTRKNLVKFAKWSGGLPEEAHRRQDPL